MRTDNQYDRFPISKRGYDPHAVEAFLDVAAADSDRMLNEAAARIAALESELEEAKRQEEAVHLTILAATAAKDDMLEAARHQAGELTANGRKEGDRIVTDARMQAFQLVTGARKEAETIVVEARAEAAAVARVDDESEVSADGPTEREKALQERIDEMQHVVAAMELELSNRPTAAEFEAALAEANTADKAAAEDADNVEDSSAPADAPDAAPPTPAAEDHDEDEHRHRDRHQLAFVCRPALEFLVGRDREVASIERIHRNDVEDADEDVDEREQLEAQLHGPCGRNIGGAERLG